MVTVPRSGLRLVFLTLAFGVALLVWLGEEDSLGYLSAMGWGLAVLLGLHLLVRRAGGLALAVQRWLVVTAAGGALAGLSAVPATMTLMALKVSLHGHGGALDYPPEALLAIALAGPAWTLAGGLSGLGLGLLYWAGGREQG
jgi:hypothetical protein